MFYREINFDFNNYKLILNDNNKYDNMYTVIIGNNGVGKSRFLSHIIKETYKYNFEEKTLFTFEEKVSKIIAITSSPFDKFPSERLFNRLEKFKYIVNNEENLYSKEDNLHYKYLGLKDERGYFINKHGNFFKIIDSIFDINNISTEKRKKLSQTFKFLGYAPFLRLTYKKQYSSIFEVIYSVNSLEELIKYKFNINSSLANRLIYKLEREPSLFDTLKGILSDPDFDFREKIKFDFELDFNNLQLHNSYFRYLKYMEILRKVDLVKFEELYLWKSNSGKAVSFDETSSGERAILFNILGIASQIEDNSLICIDEPEISLHPEWQERYMKLLMNTFDNYKNCHFIIATHSPNIISDLSEENCFILNMDENITFNAKKYINHSSDYQLANLFKVPGFRNEYLNRESINLLSTISQKGKNVDYEDLNKAKEMINLLPKLNDNDPIKELILIIKETLEKLN